MWQIKMTLVDDGYWKINIQLETQQQQIVEGEK